MFEGDCGNMFKGDCGRVAVCGGDWGRTNNFFDEEKGMVEVGKDGKL